MPIPPQYLPAACSLTAMGMWGVSDFTGGIGARRANPFLFTTAVNSFGMLLMVALAVLAHAAFPGTKSIFWASLAGALGGSSLAFFYQALATGKMGLTAPVAAVLGAGIPTIVTAFTNGFPGQRHLIGLVLAVAGVWLISRVEDESGRPEGIGLAVISGCGFAGYYLCVHQAGEASALWLTVFSRAGSLVVTAVVLLLGPGLRAMPRPLLAMALLAGALDSIGSAFFVRAQQVGRLDAAVVLSSLYPAITVLMARLFLHEHFSRARTVGMLAALAAVPMIAG